MKAVFAQRFAFLILILSLAGMHSGTLAAQASTLQESSAQQPSGAETGAPQAPASNYKPKFPGDPARSDGENLALGYMRVVIRAQNLYKKRHQHYAPTLADLAGTGSFTKRMARTTDRGEYNAEFHSKNKGETYTIAMIPKTYDSEHRAFFADEDGVMHAEEGKPATEDSPRVK